MKTIDLDDPEMKVIDLDEGSAPAASAAPAEEEQGKLSSMWDILSGKKQVSVPKGDLAAAGRGALRGVTLNAYDPAVAGVKTLFGDESYDENMEYQRAQRKADNLIEPSAELAGGLIGAGKLSMVPRLAKAGKGGKAVLAGVGEGAAFGALDKYSSDENSLGEIAGGGLTGGAFSLAGAALGKGLQKIVSPTKLDPEYLKKTQALEDAGVTGLSAGQKTGSGFWMRGEQMAQQMDNSIDLWGPSYQNYAKTVTSKASPLGNAAPNGVIDDVWVNATRREFDDAYDSVRRNINFKRDDILKDEVRVIASDIMDDIVDTGAKRRFRQLINETTKPTFWSGEMFKKHQRTLTNTANNFAGKDRAVSEGAKRLRTALNQAAERMATDPDAVSRLKRIDQKYSMFSAIREASELGKAESKAQGILSPATLYNKLQTRIGNPNMVGAPAGSGAAVTRDASQIIRTMSDSGTAQNQDLFSSARLAGGVLLGGAGAIGGSLGGEGSFDPAGGAVGGIGGGVAGYTLGALGVLAGRPMLTKALASRTMQQYIPNQMARGPGAEAAKGMYTALSGRVPAMAEQQTRDNSLTSEQMRLLLSR